MAGALLPMPNNGDADWSGFVTIMQTQMRDWQFVSLTNTTSTGIPAIEAGSYTNINGSIYNLTPSTGGNETILNSTGISAGKDVYIKAVPAGSAVTCSFTTVIPTWSASKAGYYSGNDKYIGGCYKSTSNAYLTKFIYSNKLPDGETRPIVTKIIEIGAWKMATNASKYVNIPGYISWKKIRNVNVMIQNNQPSTSLNRLTPLNFDNNGSWHTYGLDIASTNDNSFGLTRTAGGIFNSTSSYNSTTYNRGYIIIEYKS